MDKVFFINKPANMTSFDCIAYLKHKFNYKKMGHTGTLDINATGLLIVLTGKYTKFLPYCQHNNKQYIATIEFGMDTDSKDIWGKTVTSKPICNYTDEQLHIAIQSIIGKQLQTPPIISSKKVNGKKLMQYAKENKPVHIEPKQIEVYDAYLLKNKPVTVFFNVSNGTYVRNLCEDIAHYLNNCGCMSSLVRTSIGNAKLDSATNLEDITLDDSQDILSVLDPSIKIIDVDNDLPVKQGKPLTLPYDDNQLFIRYNNEIIAVYYKYDHHIYRCLRGLF